MTDTEHPRGALDGIIVADFSRVLAGPYATMLMADLGAEVIKVERPGAGDDTRSWGPPYGPDGQATYFAAVNRNKKSICLDLRDPEDAKKARELALRADVVIENFRPGTMRRHGLGYEDIVAENPGVIYASLSGFGEGDGSKLGGYDLVVQAIGGLMSITGEAPGHEVKVGVALVDVLTGLHLGFGVLAALHHREKTGKGQKVTTNLLACSLSSLVNQASAFVGAGVVAKPMGNRHPSISPYEVYSTSAGSIAVAVGNDSLFRRFCEVLELDWLADDPRFATNPVRVQNREELRELLERAFLARGADEWFELLSEGGVPCGPVNDIASAFTFAEKLGLEPAVTIGESTSVRNPLTMSETPPTYRTPPPPLN
ncbi:CoA transferase [Corynebacterium sp. TAE3-ERU12]|uniref:CaiB/BaiF CoA transferase family protein n=1 Tax=Corynebacterium sp. TAE3-ERU12 TaxID=2849491 RepID=UPI001C442FE2|nr:CoA transferase [Corynebacterium sp. TAE3-ERU12]MBV7296006.1 CoA transferase [Corynebacterium sp. TAE3-ERU12]